MKKALLVSIVLVIGLAAVPGHAATVTATAAGTTFVPPLLQAHAGDTIRLANAEPAVFLHTLTTDESLCKNSSNAAIQCTTGTIGPGGFGQFVLPLGTPAGRHQFHCQIHQWMVGVIVV